MKTWQIDQAHSTIGFRVKHLMIAHVRGHFDRFSGTLTASDENFADAHVEFSAAVASLNTGHEQRDGHLRSADLFDAEKFPALSFHSTAFEKKGGRTFRVTGEFTMKGITKEIDFFATYDGLAKGLDEKEVISFSIQGEIKRSDFGVAWNAPLAAGGVVVGDKVELDISLELKQA